MKKNKIFIVLASLLVLLLIIVTIYFNSIKKEADSIAIHNPDLSTKDDGGYLGEYAIGPVYVRAKVDIKDHMIENINIEEHDNGLGGKAEIIIDDIKKEQSLKIDTISGATVSSKCILKAVENALEGE